MSAMAVLSRADPGHVIRPGCRLQELLYDKQKLLQNGDRCCPLHCRALLGRIIHKCAQAQCARLVVASGSDDIRLMQLQDILDI